MADLFAHCTTHNNEQLRSPATMPVHKWMIPFISSAFPFMKQDDTNAKFKCWSTHLSIKLENFDYTFGTIQESIIVWGHTCPPNLLDWAQLISLLFPILLARHAFPTTLKAPDKSLICHMISDILYCCI